MATCRKYVFSGTCLCGHSWKEHHLSMVMRQEYIDATGEYEIPGACLKYGSHEYEGLGLDGELHCAGYVDKDDLERRESWQGVRFPS